MHALFSSQGRTAMVGFQPMTCLSRLITPSTSLRVSQGDGLRACFSSTMPQVIKSVQRMRSQLGGCLKVLVPILLGLPSTQFSQPQRRAGPTSKVAHACAVAGFLTVNHSYSISSTITLPCPDGLRAWKLSFVSGGCGQRGTRSSVPGISLPHWSH